MPQAVKVRHKLLTLELGRGLAALVVLLFHLEDTSFAVAGYYPFDNAFVWGHAGVAYFFVLSGFLMTLVHGSDLGRAGMARAFIGRRAVRLLPMLWTVLLALAVARFLLPNLMRTDVSLARMAGDMLLIPYPGQRLLDAIWTLKREALFYALFAFAIHRPRAGIPVIVAWQVLSLLNAILRFMPGFYGMLFFFDIYNVGFGLGMLAALLYRRLPHRAGWSMTCAALGAAVLVGTCAVEWLLGRSLPPGTSDALGDQLGPGLQVLAASVMLYGLLDLERAGRLAVPRWSALAGGMSYTLYLVHEPLLSFTAKFYPLLGPRIGLEGFCVLVTLVALTVAVAVHLVYERPLQRIVATSFLQRPGSRPLGRVELTRP